MSVRPPARQHTVDGIDGVDDRPLAIAVSVVRAARDPALPGLGLAVIVTVAGFALLHYGWRGAARTLAVGVQSPEVVSGGIAGLALVGFGAALATRVLQRRSAAAERAVTAAIAAQAVELAVAAPELRRRAQARRRR